MRQLASYAKILENYNDCFELVKRINCICGQNKKILYYISDGSNIKIGNTNNIIQRINSLQTGNANILIPMLIGIGDAYSVELIESHCHQIYNQYITSAKNEWFAIPEEQIYEIDSLMKYYLDNIYNIYGYFND